MSGAKWATITDVETQFPELVGMVTDLWIDVAKCAISPALWCDKRFNGHMLAVAHITVANGTDAATGGLQTVTSRQIDKLKTTYSASATGGGGVDWQSTKYGQLFFMMKCSRPTIGSVTSR